MAQWMTSFVEEAWVPKTFVEQAQKCMQDKAIALRLREAQQEIRGLWLRTQAKANLLSVERQRRRQLEALIKSLEVEAGAAP